MHQYIVRRLLIMIPTLFITTVVSFGVIKLAPGDPVTMMTDPNIRTRATDIVQIRSNLGLDKPIVLQYWRWLLRVMRGDLGYSLVSHRPVLEEIGERFPATLELIGLSLIATVVIAIPLGTFQAVRKYSLLDYVFTTISFIGISAPSFWVGMMAILAFSLTLGWLPSAGMHGKEFLVFHLSPHKSILEYFPYWVDHILHLILPLGVLTFIGVAQWSRFMRSKMLDVISEDYIRTAESKGLGRRAVIMRHGVRNALIPIVTLMGLSLSAVVDGAFITETIFAWPGLGRLGVGAVFRRDYPILMGTILISAILVMIGNLLADISYAYLDPRIRFEGEGGR
ncbi:MAG: ABC transporter permease [bacterium]